MNARVNAAERARLEKESVEHLVELAIDSLAEGVELLRDAADACQVQGGGLGASLLRMYADHVDEYLGERLLKSEQPA